MIASQNYLSKCFPLKSIFDALQDKYLKGKILIGFILLRGDLQIGFHMALKRFWLHNTFFFSNFIDATNRFIEYDHRCRNNQISSFHPKFQFNCSLTEPILLSSKNSIEARNDCSEWARVSYNGANQN